jgi:hypothetical protein
VPARNGASLPQRGDAAGTQKLDVFGKRPPSKPNPDPNQAQSKRRSGRDNPPTGGPRHGYASKSAQPTSETRFAVYSGQDRLGSYGQAGDAWVAFTRLGREIGTFASQNEAIVAIERGAKS